MLGWEDAVPPRRGDHRKRCLFQQCLEGLAGPGGERHAATDHDHRPDRGTKQVDRGRDRPLGRSRDFHLRACRLARHGVVERPEQHVDRQLEHGRAGYAGRCVADRERDEIGDARRGGHPVREACDRCRGRDLVDPALQNVELGLAQRR